MLRRKLLIRIGLLIDAFVGGAVIAIWLLQNALTDIDQTNRDAVVLIGGTQSISGAVTSIQVAREKRTQGESSGLVAGATRDLNEAISAIGAHHAVTMPGAASAAYQRLRRVLPEFIASNTVLSQMDTPEALASSIEVQTAVQSLGEALRKHVAAEQTNLGRHFRALVLGLTLAALVMVNVAIVVLLRTAQVVLKPVAALVEGSRELAAERFDHRVQVDQDDEFGELAHAYNQLAGELQANEERKAETLRQLAVTLNHDLNNAMTVIELQLGLLDRQTSGNPLLARHLNEIRSNLAQMSGTVASLKNIRRVVLTDYVPGQKMLDLPRSVAPSNEPAPITIFKNSPTQAARAKRRGTRRPSMKKHLPWHHTPVGTVVLLLGSIELAVPILALTALALAVGTYLDSTKGAAAAKEAVYGSWWFIATMGLVCVSLIFAVFTRYPWKRRHVGFITVHASLLGLIAGGFVSLFGRVEGHLPLEEGKAASTMETQDEQVEVVELQPGQFSVLASAPGPKESKTLTLAGTRFQVVERWDNSREEQIVNDDAPQPFRGVQVVAQPGADPIWVGEEGKGGAAPVIAGLTVRVLPDGASWEAPAKPVPVGGSTTAAFKFVVGGHEFPLGEEGQEAFAGWKIQSIKRYTRALVGDSGLIETQGGPENPAVDVLITDGKGNTERHTAFLNFADMVMSRAVEGVASSGARLMPGTTQSASETLIVFGPVSETRIGYISPTGEARTIESSGDFPRTIDLGMRRVTIARQFARARGGWQTLKAEAAKDNRPALVVRVGDATELTVVPFKGTCPVPAPDRTLLFRYGPRTVTVPFTIRLVDFRKTDYPGTEMAMAYESNVEVALPGEAATPYRIFMNHPFSHGPWKVYQSGFVGDTVSIFSIMRDPGLPLTYAASALLCVGILITFFSRSLSWGHPGIPVAFVERESPHASPAPPAAAPHPAPAINGLISAGGV